MPRIRSTRRAAAAPDGGMRRSGLVRPVQTRLARLVRALLARVMRLAWCASCRPRARPALQLLEAVEVGFRREQRGKRREVERDPLDAVLRGPLDRPAHEPLVEA